MKQLDFVRTPNGGVAIIIERSEPINGIQAQFSIEMLNGFKTNEKTAWWVEEELVLIDSLPNLLSRIMAHKSSPSGRESVDKQFPIK